MSYQTNLKIAEILVETQVRKKFDAAAHLELVESIKSHGVLQPLLVRDLGEAANGKYLLVAGERRLRAAKEAGLDSVPVNIVFGGAEQHSEMQLVENLQRQDLSLEETAAAVDALYKRFGKMSDVAKTLSKSMPWVSKMVAVANKLGKYATELLAGGHTQDVELLTTLTRAEELDNSYPRVEQLTEEIKQNKAGRKEVQELYDLLKRELENPPTAEDGGDEVAEDAAPIQLFPVLDEMHSKIIGHLTAASESWKQDDPAKAFGPKNAAQYLSDALDAYRAQALQVLQDMNPAAVLEVHSERAAKRKAK